MSFTQPIASGARSLWRIVVIAPADTLLPDLGLLMAEDQGRYDQPAPVIVASLDTAADFGGPGQALLVLTGQAIAPEALAHFRQQRTDAAVVLVLDDGDVLDPALAGSNIDGLITAADRADAAVVRARLAMVTHAWDRLAAARMVEHSVVMASSEPAPSQSGAKSANVAAVVHELRTPLNGIVGMLEVLRQGGLDEEQTESIDTIEQSTGALLRIINDLLDAAKIEAGKLDIEAIAYDPVETIEQTVAAIVPGFASDAVLPVVFIDPTVPTRLVGDPNRLRQVVTNLVSNAFKFTHAGQVSVTATTLERDGQRWLQLTVADTGIGMSADTMANLFQPFAQADASTARKYGGTGLGLNVSYRLVDLMGGVMQVTSTLGSGSRFWFELPLRTVADAPARHSNWLKGKGVVTLSLDQATTEAVLAYAGMAGAWTHALTPATLTSEAETALAADTVITPADPALAEQLAAAITDAGAGPDITKGLIVIGDATPGWAGIAAPAALKPRTRLSRPVRESALIRALVKKHDAGMPRPRTVVEDTHPPEIKIDHPILLVDDHPTNRDVMSRQFKTLGLPCEVLSDAALALEALEQRPFAAILSDCEMSGISGFELANRVRHMINQQRLPPMPLLAITAHIDPLERERALAAGFDACLTKPLTLNALQEVLNRFLVEPQRRYGAAPAAIPPPPAPTPAQPASTMVVDVDRLIAMLGVERADVPLVLMDFGRASRKDIASIDQAIATGDPKAVVKAAHKIKGAAAMVAALALEQACADLEAMAKRTPDQWSTFKEVAGEIAIRFEQVIAYDPDAQAEQ